MFRGFWWISLCGEARIRIYTKTPYRPAAHRPGSHRGENPGRWVLLVRCVLASASLRGLSCESPAVGAARASLSPHPFGGAPVPGGGSGMRSARHGHFPLGVRGSGRGCGAARWGFLPVSGDARTGGNACGGPSSCQRIVIRLPTWPGVPQYKLANDQACSGLRPMGFELPQYQEWRPFLIPWIALRNSLGAHPPPGGGFGSHHWGS